MQTKDFQTKTINMPCKFPCNEKHWVIGLDIGYSGVKGISPNKYFCFPAYAKKIPEDRVVLRDAVDSDIRYRDASGEWVVGDLAYAELNATEIIDSEEELYGRNRYFSDMFRVVSRTGIALGLLANDLGNPEGKKLSIQTGLPPKYLKQDTPYLKDVLAGTHIFEIKLGRHPWQKFTYTLDSNNIYVIPQPLGALLSASIDKTGKVLPIAKKYFSSNLIVFDPGFGTTDTYPVRSGNVIGTGETFPEYSMHEVFSRTCQDIYNNYGRELSITQLQTKLKDGIITITDRRQMRSENKSFASILDRNCRNVCSDVVEKLKSVYDYFSDYDYIIAAGGTYDAWAEDFNAVFKGMQNLLIVPGNINDPSLSNIFSNVRGYYFNLVNRLR